MTISTLQQLSHDLADLQAQAASAVLRVEGRRRLPASGIAWSQKHIVAAHHAVEFEDDIFVGLADGERLRAELIGRDPRQDLALLQTDAQLSPLARATDMARVGSLVLALGRPGQQVKAALGIVAGSASPRPHKAKRLRGARKPHRARRKRAMRAAFGHWRLPTGMIQTDLVMYPGFSGGPLLGADGLVYGMNTSGFAGGRSLALPVPNIETAVATLLKYGEIQRGYLGLGIQSVQLPPPIADATQQESGLLIVAVEHDSPAAAADMLVGDILISLAGNVVEDVDELRDLLAQLDIGSEVELQFARGGQLQKGLVCIGKR